MNTGREFFLVIFAAYLLHAYANNCPRLFSRSQWVARPPVHGTQRKEFPGSPKFVVIHHTRGAECRQHSGCAAQMRALQNAHFRAGYNDINVNFAVGGNGFVYEGTGWFIQNEVSPKFDNRVLNIAFMGNFNRVLPSQRQIDTMAALIKCGIQQGFLSPDVQFVGHTQLRQTDCPGASLFQHMHSWPRFNKNPV